MYNGNCCFNFCNFSIYICICFHYHLSKWIGLLLSIYSKYNLLSIKLNLLESKITDSFFSCTHDQHNICYFD